jgi:hypothetical protein
LNEFIDVGCEIAMIKAEKNIALKFGLNEFVILIGIKDIDKTIID